MKTNFAKKTIKILTITIFSVFVLVQVFFASSVYAETTEITECGWTWGECVVTTIDFEEEGKKITRVMEIPMVEEGETEDGRVTDNYTDNEGKKQYRTGTVNIDEEVTYISDWITEEEYEKAIEDNDGASLFEDPDKNKNELTDNGSEKFTYTLLQPLPQEGGTYLQENVTLEEYLTWVYKFILALAGFLAVMMIVIGGVEWIISGANEGMRTEAKKRISNAIWGLVMALAAYLVLYTINPSLVDFENNQFFKEEEIIPEE